MRGSGSLVTLVLLLGIAAATAFSGDRRFEKKFSVAPGGTLKLTTDLGSVTVTGTSASEVSVVADLRGRQKDVDRFDISAEQTSTGVEVQGRGQKSSWWFWNSNDLDIRYTVKVPRDYSLTIHTSGGDLNVDNVAGTIKGGTSGGNIALGDVQGAVDLNTSGGNIRADKVKGDLRLETSGGEIAIASVAGDVDVETSGGNVRIRDVDGKVHAETSGGDITVSLKGGNKGVFAETSGGNIDIYVAKSIAATIDASTSGGEVICDLPVTMSGRIDESRVHGTVNGGGNTIHAHTSGGDVRIRATE